MPETTPALTTDQASGSAASQPQAGNNVAQVSSGPDRAQATSRIPLDQQPADGANGEPSADDAELRRQIAELRKENAAYRKQKQQQDEAALSEQEKAVKRAEAAEAKLGAFRERLILAEIKGSGAVIDPDVALKLLDRDKLEYDDNDVPTNLDKLLADLLKAKPYLAASPVNGQASSPNTQATARPAVSSGGATNPSRSGGGNAAAAGEWTWERINSLSREDYLANRASINAWQRKRGSGDGYRW